MSTIRRCSFTGLLAIGIATGVLWGLFLGQWGAWIRWVGDAYVGLMQMSVLPYVAVSLTANIGRLSIRQGGQVARVSAIVLLLLWSIGLAALAAASFAFPDWRVGSFYSSSLISEPAQPDWLELFIPSNPFRALSENLVPAAVLFFGGLGVALIPVPNKSSLLDRLDILVDALGRLNRLVLKAAPVGLFAIVGATSATLSLEQFGLLQGYLLVYGSAALLLTVWVLPALISCCTPFSIRDVLSVMRDTMITAFVIGNTFVVLPMIVDAVKRLTAVRQDEDSDESHSPEFSVQLAYPFPDVGRILGMVFIPFAAWFYGMKIDLADYPQLVGTGLLGAFAKPVVTIPLLLNLAEIPADIFQLFLIVGVVASRFGDLMKSIHLFTFAILMTSLLTRRFRLNLQRLIIVSVITLALFTLTVIGIRVILTRGFQDSYRKNDLIAARELLGTETPAIRFEEASPNPVARRSGEDWIDRIRRRGIIRIGINTTKLPFAYQNRNGELVGFDIDMAHQIARDLAVSIEFVPITGEIDQAFRDDHFDIAMSGLEATIARAAMLPRMEPYLKVTAAIVVPDFRRQQFSDLSHMMSALEGEHLRVAIVRGTISRADQNSGPSLGTGWPAFAAAGATERVEVIEIASERQFFEGGSAVADVLATNAEVGSAWTLLYPQYSVVRPKGFEAQTPLHYYVAERSQLRDFVNGWLELKQSDGTIDQLHRYWILGEDQRPTEPRWCVIRNVLGWVE